MSLIVVQEPGGVLGSFAWRLLRPRERRSLPGVAGLDVTMLNADGGVLLTLHSPGIEDLISVAERHEVMSARTTYVQPTLRTGIFLT
jgi:hypothetical protein